MTRALPAPITLAQLLRNCAPARDDRGASLTLAQLRSNCAKLMGASRKARVISRQPGGMVSEANPRKVRLALSPQAEKYARRDAPLEVRQMAARGALPLQPIELASVLFALVHDPDQEVKNTARESLEGLPESLLGTVLSGETHPAVLSYLAEVHKNSEPHCERIALNTAADDQTIVLLASLPHRRVVDIVSNNQERLLRCDDIVEALGDNPLTGRAVIERILTFLGVSTDGETAGDDLLNTGSLSEEDAQAALVALLGEGMEDVARQLAADGEGEDEEVRGNLFAVVQQMTIMQKIKLARLGGTEARALLIRDRNKIVATSVISSPKITDSEVESIAKSRNVSDEVLRLIAANREWTRSYQIKLSLVTNPKCPQATAVKFLNYIQDRDLQQIMKSRDVPSAISGQARRILQKKGKI